MRGERGGPYPTDAPLAPLVVPSRRFVGLEEVPFASALRVQRQFRRRAVREHYLVGLVQNRFKEYLRGEFTPQYLLLWTKRLEKKELTASSAVCIQSRYRGKLGRRVAWEQRRLVKSRLLQRAWRCCAARRELEYRKDRWWASSCIGRAYRAYLFRSVPLSTRVKLSVEEQEEAERKVRAQQLKERIGAVFLQSIARGWKARLLLRAAQLQRHNNIFESALLQSRRVHKPRLLVSDANNAFALDIKPEYEELCHGCMARRVTVYCGLCRTKYCR